MEFAFSSEQDELRATVRAFFAKHAAPSRTPSPTSPLAASPGPSRGPSSDSSRGRSVGEIDRPLWTKMTGELGLTALAIAEEHGGFGASLVEVAIVLEEAGRALLALPYLSTVVAAFAVSSCAPSSSPSSRPSAPFGSAAAAGSFVGDGAALRGIADGSTLGALAVADAGVATAARRTGRSYVVDGVKEHVLDGDVADLFVVVAMCDGEEGLFTVRADDIRRQGMPTLDQTRPVARVEFAGVPATRVSPPGDGGAAATRAVDVLRLALAVEAVGVAAASLEMTVAYLQTRRQFGVPLATFQALRHRIADHAVALEAATSTTWYAVRAAGSEEFPVVAPMAKVVAGEAAYAITADAIQLHGGIGFTWEHDAHRYFKRAAVTRLSHGDPVTLRRLIGTRAPALRPPPSSTSA